MSESTLVTQRQSASPETSSPLQRHPLESSESQIGNSMAPPTLQLAGDDGAKTVSGTAMTRLNHAEEAIKYTKGILKFGAGNQLEALKSSKFNSNFRMGVARKEKYWDLTPEARKLADADPAAYKAARAEIAQGGNCGEHANLAYQYLRHKAVGQEIARGSVSGFDHAFTFVGPAGGAKDMSETAVSDPWPTAPKAVLWDDHFAKSAMGKPADLKVKGSMVADGGSPKDLIKAGLSLNAAGLKRINLKLTQQDTDDRIDKHEDERSEKADLENDMKDMVARFRVIKAELAAGTHKGQAKTDAEAEMKNIVTDFKAKEKRLKEIKIWMWGQEDAHEEGHDYDYETPSWLSQAWEEICSWF